MEEARSQVRRQVKMVEDCLKKLTEVMGKLSLERKAMEDRIRLHHATLLGHAGGDAYCACVTSLKHGCDDQAERMDTYMTEAQQALDTVQQQLSGSPPAPLSQAQQRAALFVQGDLQTILSRTSSTTTSLLRHEVKDNTPLLAECLESFMGKVVERSQDPDTVQSREAANPPDLHSDQGVVSSGEATASSSRVPDTTACDELCEKVNDLASQVSSLQAANTQLTQQVTESNSANSSVSSEQSSVQRDTTTAKEKNSKLTTGMAAKNKGAFSEHTVKPAQGSSSQDKSQNNKAQSQISKRLLRRAGKKGGGKDRPPSNVQTGHAQNHHAQHTSNVQTGHAQNHHAQHTSNVQTGHAQNHHAQHTSKVRTSTTGTRQGVEQEAPPNGTVLPAGGPLTASMLADVPPQEQKQMLGECLYYQIQRMYPDLAGKITGMLLELDISELLEIQESQECVQSKAEEAVAVLERHEAELAAASAAAASAAAGKK